MKLLQEEIQKKFRLNKIMKIPIAKTYLNEAEIQSVLEPLRSGWLVQGPKVKEFENMWSEFTNAKHSIAVTSCTSALHLSLVASGFSAGDEAIVPAFTWISTANVIEHLGGKAVFVDIDLNSFNIDTSLIENLITPKTKAILPVHLFGLAADMKSICDIAKRHKLFVIEDAACGFGSLIDNKHVGTFGNTGCFSFHPRKAITTGEGGMITTNNDELADKLRKLRDHGASTSDLQRHLGPKPYLLADHPYAGYNQRMTDIQAALGAAQMKRAKEIIKERREIARQYTKAFSHLEWLKVPNHDLIESNGFQSYPCLFEPTIVKEAIKNKDYRLLSKVNEKRNNWMEKMQELGISTRPATHAVHMLSYYSKKYKINKNKYPNSFAANDCSISIPLFNGMSEDEKNFVIKTILEGYK